jgi:hypothetical protein
MVLNESNDGKQPLTPTQTLEHFRACIIGQETIGSEIGYDMFTNTISTATALGFSMLPAEVRKPKPLTAALRSLRGFALIFYVLVHSATRAGSKSSFAALLGMLAVGGAILGFALPAGRQLPLALTGLGVVLVVGGLILATARAGGFRVLATIVMTLVVAIAPFVYLRYHLMPVQGWRKALHDSAPVAPLVAPILGTMALGLVRRNNAH